MECGHVELGWGRPSLWGCKLPHSYFKAEACLIISHTLCVHRLHYLLDRCSIQKSTGLPSRFTFAILTIFQKPCFIFIWAPATWNVALARQRTVYKSPSGVTHYPIMLCGLGYPISACSWPIEPSTPMRMHASNLPSTAASPRQHEAAHVHNWLWRWNTCKSTHYNKFTAMKQPY